MRHQPKFVAEALERLETYCSKKSLAVAIHPQRIRGLRKIWRVYVVVPAWKNLRQSQRQRLAEKIMSGKDGCGLGLVTKPGFCIFVHVLPSDWVDDVLKKKLHGPRAKRRRS